MKKSFILLVLLFGLYGNAFAQSHEGHHHPKNDGKITTPELLTEVLEGDVIYGKQDAPVTIVEYASLTCGHCAAFYNDVMGKLKENYISKGKVKLIYRHYPLNSPALQAALLIECAEGNELKKQLLDTLFTTQKEWAFSGEFNTKLRDIAGNAGINSESYYTCVGDSQKQNQILGLQLDAQKGLSVQSTPTLFINDKRYSGKSYDALSKHLDGLIESANSGKHEGLEKL